MMTAIREKDFDTAYATAGECIAKCAYLASTVGIIKPPKHRSKLKNILPQKLSTVVGRLGNIHRFLESERGKIEKVSHWHLAVSAGPFGEEPETLPTAHEFAWRCAYRMWREMAKLVGSEIRCGRKKPTQGLVLALRRLFLESQRRCDAIHLAAQLKLEHAKGLAEFRRANPLPLTPPAGGAGESEGDDGRPKLNPSVRLAYLAFKAAEAQAERRLEDREAHDLLKENGLPSDKGDLGELAEYELPAFDTWSRYVRDGRKAMGEQKYQKRSGRAHGKSIASPGEI